MQNKSILKSAGMYMCSFLAAAAITAGSIFGLTGCIPETPENPNDNTNQNETPNSNQNNNQNTDNNQNQENPPQQTPDVLTYQEFVAQYPLLAKQFAVDINKELSYYDDILSTSYAFVAGETTIQQVLLANVTKTGDTERQLKIATVNLIGGVDVQDIVDGKDSPVITIDSENALEFDAKEEFFKQHSTIVEQIDTVINNKLGQDAVEVKTYTQEEFEIQSEIPTTVAQLVAEYPDKVNQVLNTHFLDDMLKKDRFTSFDASTIQSANWYVNGTDSIESLDFAFHYGSGDSKQFFVVNLTFNQPVSIESFYNNSAELSSVTSQRAQTYSTSYIQSQQGTRDSLANAIAKVVGLEEQCPEGNLRIFNDAGWGTAPGLGEIYTFVIIEIAGNSVHHQPIAIKNAYTDEEFIKKLNSPDNYYITPATIVELNGEMLEYKPAVQKQAPQSKQKTAGEVDKYKFID